MHAPCLFLLQFKNKYPPARDGANRGATLLGCKQPARSKGPDRRLAAPLSLRLRCGLLASAFTRTAREGTSTGLFSAAVPVFAAASLADSAGLLSSFNACMNCTYFIHFPGALQVTK
jgi:hypothetical protein